MSATKWLVSRLVLEFMHIEADTEAAALELAKEQEAAAWQRSVDDESYDVETPPEGGLILTGIDHA
jgi:hypothetical protein